MSEQYMTKGDLAAVRDRDGSNKHDNQGSTMRLKARVRVLEAVLLELLESFEPPPGNCSCHLAPPCSDCVEYGTLREAQEQARDVLTNISKPPTPWRE